MASVAGTNAVLDPAGTGFGTVILIQTTDGVKNQNYVKGGVGKAGRDKWITTNVADSDAVQAAAILTGLL